jgi:hypothetical protein
MVISALAAHVINGLSDLRTVSSQHMTSSIWGSPQRHVAQVHEIVLFNHWLTVQ